MQQYLEFTSKIPKIELHAHLNGCIKDSTLKELLQNKLQSKDFKFDEQYLNIIEKGEVKSFIEKGDRTLSEIFKLFEAINSVTTENATITYITKQVLLDFCEDNVIYLELRTTPKNKPELGISKESYVQAVLQGIREFQTCEEKGQRKMMVKLILSIDRKEDSNAAIQTVELAHKFSDDGVVGIDLCGNPSIGEWETWLPALQLARKYHLSMALHAGEVWNKQETLKMLQFQPERLAHMVCTDEELNNLLVESQIPLELCLTSNVLSKSVESYSEHHLLELQQKGYPVALCTDDSGVFQTTLSQELALACQHLNLKYQDIINLQENAIKFAFLADNERLNLEKEFKEQLKISNGYVQ